MIMIIALVCFAALCQNLAFLNDSDLTFSRKSSVFAGLNKMAFLLVASAAMDQMRLKDYLQDGSLT